MRRTLACLGAIQRAIVSRAPLGDVLDAIVEAAEHLLGDENPALFLRDEHDPDELIIAAHRLPPDMVAVVRRRPVGSGVGGRTVLEDRVVTIEDYADQVEGTIAAFRERGLTAAMAAPIHDDDGAAVGCLLVSTYRPGRRYSPEEREVLVALADHASLALRDAREVARMAHAALHDPLTGLPNRVLFEDRLRHARDRSGRSGACLAVLFCDLDGFKTVNDRHGHAAGDELLREVAGRIAGCLRVGDTAARLGGDEFALLLEDVDEAVDVPAVAHRVLAALAEPFEVEEHPVAITASIGIARACGTGTDDLLRCADRAMYVAKSGGGNLAVVHAPAPV